ncbi:5-amino-6-(D-ribitylamino)uracil--L-tyrosine 4-hydroxyphenyl transferase CofH [Ancylobacter sonchi]|uniref:5-amino-6-(D-ribitylamino)uracil--L-tyrosine 4-hydroxyphenyl transferase CofH n=1 Tax=Ancylobacter sonchi TaxID=1937790 RepID=UPI001BD3F9F8|nr:5-amino-6-(D-ribitylamino)uracil--L-tyrosine 4-hydroxyphenyl transferase CofH [Ancylobacter sonchi]MBS7536433.1 5-amino-6-(D-ribitylamino)uracil--L-tyrosine 4-hydroxyphenyl transferase CofH [Ancylobacter sonchi]
MDDAAARWDELARQVLGTGGLDRDAALALAGEGDTAGLMRAAASVRDAGFGSVVTVSRKVFIPLTQLCRDVCHYCTFAHPPRRGQRAFLTPEEVLEIARAGARVGCDEALFTLGDKPELRYKVVREELAALGYATTLDYLAAMAELVLKETGLLPHLNAGVLTVEDLRMLRKVSASQGMMIETTSERLSARGGPHFGSPDKLPAARLATLEAAGGAQVPFTTGLLIGIGETRAERVEALLSIRDSHARHGHVQEVIIQNFRAKAGTRMAEAPEPSLDEHLWTIALARLILGASISIQAPPNLRAAELAPLIAAGINDWGGVSPVTPDHVNPEAPWPALAALATATAKAGKVLSPRLAVYPAYLFDASRWLDKAVTPFVLRRADAGGLAHESGWRVGEGESFDSTVVEWPANPVIARPAIAGEGHELDALFDKAFAGRGLEEAEIVRLFDARGHEAQRVAEAADALRREAVGDTVSYVVTRNINYTNVCSYRCGFCAFSKGRHNEHLRGKPYELDLGEIQRRTIEAWERGATEVCMQGGIHPDFSGETYLSIVRAVKQAVPDMHVHAFSSLEVRHGASTLGLSVTEFLIALKEAGLGTLPGTAAEILDDEVRAIICPDKLNTAEWLETIGAAHRVGLKTTSTIMFGHVDHYRHWARHLIRLRHLQEETGGITELVPLPFLHMEAPLYLKGGTRQGPSRREALLMHAVGRLALHPVIPNVQASWVKLGEGGIVAALRSGANDIGGTLMDESISRAAGGMHGQEFPPDRMEAAVRASGRLARQRTTTYTDAPSRQKQRSYAANALTPRVEAAAGKFAKVGSLAARRG